VQVVGRREVKKTKPELASESGVFENEPTTVVEGVVRSADLPTSDVDQVPSVDVSILVPYGGSVAEWLACWTQVQKGLGSNRSRDALG